MDMTETSRWLNQGAFSEGWAGRSELLLEMFIKAHGKQNDWTFTEYGCGYYRPFYHAAKIHSKFHVLTCDLKKWSNETIICDLNSNKLSPESTDVCVLSGVCEYLNDLKFVFGKLSKYHKHFLFSYAVFSQPKLKFSFKSYNEQFVAELHSRSVVSGWRNHFTIEQMIEIVSDVGRIVDIRMWRGQVLFYVKCHDELGS